MNRYQEQLRQLIGAEIVQVEFFQNPDFSEPVPCLVVRKNGCVLCPVDLGRR